MTQQFFQYITYSSMSGLSHVDVCVRVNMYEVHQLGDNYYDGSAYIYIYIYIDGCGMVD